MTSANKFDDVGRGIIILSQKAEAQHSQSPAIAILWDAAIVLFRGLIRCSLLLEWTNWILAVVKKPSEVGNALSFSGGVSDYRF